MEYLAKLFPEWAVMIIALLSWMLFSFIEGYREAVFFYKSMLIDKPLVTPNDFLCRLNIHTVFTITRICVWIPFFFFTPWLFVIGLAFLFPYIHDGSLYLYRNVYDSNVYKARFFSEPSKTSNAKVDFSLNVRTGMFVIGVWAIIFSFIHQL
jgi:hypothetical protein